MGLEAVVFVDDPIGFLAVGSSTTVKDESLSHTDKFGVEVNGLVPARGFPETGHGGSVSPRPSRILFVFVAEEVPLLLLLVPYPTSLYTYNHYIYNSFKITYSIISLCGSA